MVIRPATVGHIHILRTKEVQKLVLKEEHTADVALTTSEGALVPPQSVHWRFLCTCCTRRVSSRCGYAHGT